MDLAGISELSALSSTGTVESTCILTSTYSIMPSSIISSSTLAAVERDVLLPLQALRAAGQVEITDFTSLVATWKGQYGGKACIYR